MTTAKQTTTVRALGNAWQWASRRLGSPDRGSAVVEFLGVALLLLVPTVYLIVTLGQIQAASFAAEGAAREAGRILAHAETYEQGLSAAHLAVELSFADQGIEVSGAQALQVTCQADPCLTPGAHIHLWVHSSVELPGVPAFLAGALPAATQVQAEAMTVIPQYRQERP